MLKPRYYQADAVKSFFDYTLNEPGKHPLIVIPTAGGKSFIQALIVKRMLDFPNVRVLLITHQQELIRQNASELLGFLDDRLLDVGIYSAGLKSRDTRNQILFAGIQSVHKRAWELGHFDIIMVDEAHRIPQKSIGTYRKFLDEMFKINPKIIIGGLSATPYRMKDGMLTEGDDAIFDDICHSTSIPELINPNHFKNRDQKQYLCNIISKNSINQADLTGVHVRGGDYVQGEMERAFNKNDLITRTVQEIKDLASNRKKILVFTAGIAHCEAVTEEFIRQGMEAKCIHSQKGDAENEETLNEFRNDLRILVNVDVLTTGFNQKNIDCICLLRSTKSPSLYCQIVGRGLRMHPDKENCLILDFGGNILLHGPIDKIEIKKNKEGKGEIHTAPQKECPECHDVIALQTMICPSCGYVFPQKDKHSDTASMADVLSKWKKPTEFDVHDVYYSRHKKDGKPDSMMVEYACDEYRAVCFREWVCIEHTGFAKRKAVSWMKKRTDEDISTVTEALEKCKTFDKPLKIIVDENDKFPKISGCVFAPRKTKEEIAAEKEAAFETAMEALM